ncbi:DUF2304 domain-containing protein [Cellulomonas sp. NPDC057328]|uniref:DUF2304 domain-containing protein n=1 Tax=Cellulomonas sp. NPDC057328 TaxID=3346101 RepID=UPI003640268A
MSGYALSVGICVVLAGAFFWLLRSRRVREKYTAIWFVVVLGVCVVGAVPGLVFGLASALGVVAPSNLVFALAIVVLLIVCIQLSVEVSNLEEETRTIAEELALLRAQIEARPVAPTADDGDGATGRR